MQMPAIDIFVECWCLWTSTGLFRSSFNSQLLPPISSSSSLLRIGHALSPPEKRTSQCRGYIDQQQRGCRLFRAKEWRRHRDPPERPGTRSIRRWFTSLYLVTCTNRCLLYSCCKTTARNVKSSFSPPPTPAIEKNNKLHSGRSQSASSFSLARRPSYEVYLMQFQLDATA